MLWKLNYWTIIWTIIWTIGQLYGQLFVHRIRAFTTTPILYSEFCIHHQNTLLRFSTSIKDSLLP